MQLPKQAYSAPMVLRKATDGTAAGTSTAARVVCGPKPPWNRAPDSISFSGGARAHLGSWRPCLDANANPGSKREPICAVPQQPPGCWLTMQQPVLGVTTRLGRVLVQIMDTMARVVRSWHPDGSPCQCCCTTYARTFFHLLLA